MRDKILDDQFNELITSGNDLIKKAKYSDLSDIPNNVRQRFVSRSAALIKRVCPNGSSYYSDIERVINTIDRTSEQFTKSLGIIEALFEDVKNDQLLTYEELIHGDIFSDYLEMAEYLVNSDYKDPAAVIAGSTLESHLKKLCKKNDIDIIEIDASGKQKQIKADRLNNELAKKSVYSILDQKSITSWLDLRNKAAHGNYSEYSIEQVRIMITSIRDFVSRYTA